MGLSDIVRNEMLQDLLTRHASVYLALSTTDPGGDGSGISEPADTYIRQLVDVTITGSQILLDAAVSFPLSSINWGTLSHGAIFDDETAGVFVGSSAITATPCPANTVVTIPQGTVLVDLT